MFNIFNNKPFKCFTGEYKDLDITSRSYKGIKAIEVDKIVGSVGRCHDNGSWDEIKDTGRFRGIKESMEKMKTFPPIEVYKVKDEYYILDGHHRVMAGREVGKEFIDAEVYEYEFSDTRKEKEEECDYVGCPMKNFQEKTGVKGILLSSKQKYDELLQYIKKFGDSISKNSSIEEIAQIWYEKDFLPLIKNKDEESEPGKTCSEKYYEQKIKKDNS